MQVPFGFDDWRSGVKARELTCVHAYGADNCRDNDSDPLEDSQAPDTTAEFDPDTIYLPYGCEGGMDFDEQTWVDEAEALLSAKLPFMFARELWTGARTGNPSLQSAGMSISDTTPIPPAAAMDILVASWEECSQGLQGLIHAPSSLMSGLGTNAGVKRQGNLFLTPNGHIVSPGPGYPQSPGTWGPKTGGDPDGIAAPDGTAWMFISSMVEFAGPKITGNIPNKSGEQLDSRLNWWEVRPKLSYIYRFDTACCVFAALCKIPTLDA